VLAFITPKFSRRRHFKLTSFNFQGFALNQCLGHLFVRRLNDPSKGLTRDFHLFRCLLLVQALKVSKPDRLEFVNTQNDFFQHRKWDTSWLKVIAFRHGTNSPAIDRP
jgi:hypothetical protein